LQQREQLAPPTKYGAISYRAEVIRG
jgi:hypothetical protein